MQKVCFGIVVSCGRQLAINLAQNLTHGAFEDAQGELLSIVDPFSDALQSSLCLLRRGQVSICKSDSLAWLDFQIVTCFLKLFHGGVHRRLGLHVDARGDQKLKFCLSVESRGALNGQSCDPATVVDLW